MNTGWEQALEVQGELFKEINGPFWGEMGGAWLRNREQKYGRNAMLPSAHAFRYAAEIVSEAEPIFVTSEMLDLTRAAMESFDSSEEMHAEDLFLRSGMALLQEPFVATDAEGLETAWRCVTWRYVDLPPEAGGPENSEPIPAVEIILWWSLDDTDEWDENHEAVMDMARAHYRSWGMRWAVMHATVTPFEYISEIAHMGNEGDPAASWMSFLRVLNKLMAERIVLKTPMRPQRAFRRSVQRLGIVEPKDVIVCELRRARPRGFEWEQGDGESHLSHRFLVAGHWRNQWYPSLKRHKQKWISPYVKGPDDKPFVDKKRVWVWDR